MTYSLGWLPDVLLKAGLKVSLVDGWETRGRGEMGKVEGVICHHTAGSRNGNMPSLRLLKVGRPDLSGPLSQLGLGRDGTFYVIAAGRCNHAGKGEWRGFTSGNSSFIGIEAENTGSHKDFPWPEVQMDAYRRGVAAILGHLGKGAEFCAGHREYARPTGRKDDPLFDMVAFRAGVGAILAGKVPAPVPIPAVASDGSPTLRRPMQTAAVPELQRLLGVEQKGIFGPRTEAAVRDFQRDYGLVPDGIVGPKTWVALHAASAASPGAILMGATPTIMEVAEPLGLAPASPLPAASGDMRLEQAQALLEALSASVNLPSDASLTSAIQRALAELYLLNPADDVDGQLGARTRLAWRLFVEGVGPHDADVLTITPARARSLAGATRKPAAFLGDTKVKLQAHFPFRRNHRSENRDASVRAILAEAKAQKLTDGQTAYVLATAEHETDRFATLEEYASGAAYEHRSDLGNTRSGDGQLFKGRGFVQLTGRANYAQYADRTGIKLVQFPVVLMNWGSQSAWLLVDGMMRGAFTGKPLDRYINPKQQNFREARRVVNGVDQADKIAQQAEGWLVRLKDFG